MSRRGVSSTALYGLPFQLGHSPLGAAHLALAELPLADHQLHCAVRALRRTKNRRTRNHRPTIRPQLALDLVPDSVNLAPVTALINGQEFGRAGGLPLPARPRNN